MFGMILHRTCMEQGPHKLTLVKGLMMKLIKKAGLAIFLVGILPLTANAQNIAGYLTNVQGQVLIERGGTLLQASEQSALLAGDKVITSHNSSTDITLNDCRARLQNTQAVNLGFRNHCANIGNISNVRPNYAPQNIGGPVGSPPRLRGLNPALLVVGAGILAGAVIALASGGGDDDDVAVSP